MSGRLLRAETLRAMTDFGPEGYGLGLARSTGGGHEFWVRMEAAYTHEAQP